MPLNLKTASGGSVIITGANTASDRTITVPAADGNMLYSDSSGNAQINSGYGSLATGYVARAWVNFNGTGTVAIRASGNVSSITDLGVGDYQVNLTTAMPDVNYAVGAISGLSVSLSQTGVWWRGGANATSSFQIFNYSTGGTTVDEAFMSAFIFR